MAANINADTSGGLKLTSDTSGVLELKSAGTTIATVSNTGIAMASGKTLPATTAVSLTTASGSAPSFSARAWVNFNGTGTPAIRASGNVSSITDSSTGQYFVNFSTAMPDINFYVGCSRQAISSVAGNTCYDVVEERTTSKVKLVSVEGNVVHDSTNNNVTIIR
tara:strand:- start:141 stop:632 length:492 start_codon:yes stop_codon:yes gene_type:complete